MKIKLYISILLTVLILCHSSVSFANKEALQNESALLFIENKGQITDQYYNVREDIDYKLNAPGIDIFIGDGVIHYQWCKRADSTALETYRLDVTLIGANKNAIVETGQAKAYYEKYYLAHCTQGVQANSFDKIRYRDIYPGIDWVIYTNGNKLKYDFIVHKGANVNNIQLQYAGATELQLQKGKLMVATPLGSITENAPYSYDAETGKAITSSYHLQDNVLGFEMAKYNSDMVIDPTIEWATYYGGKGTESLYSYYSSNNPTPVATDNKGNVYLAGTTNSVNNIATIGSPMSTQPFSAGYIAKFSPAGTRMWGMYYGTKSCISSVVCKNNSIYFAGYSARDSTIATPGAHKEIVIDNHYDGMIVKMTDQAQRIWGTFFGGDQDDMIFDMAADNYENLFVAGRTNSTAGLTTAGFNQNNRSFLAAFDSSGKQLWGNSVAGSDVIGHGTDPFPRCVAVDNFGNIYVGGSTGSKGPIWPPGSYQSTAFYVYNTGFIARFDMQGHIVWGTYYGHFNPSYWWGDPNVAGGAVNDIVTDNDANVYVCGYSNCTDSIASPNSYKDTVTHPQGRKSIDAFLGKFNSSGKFIWGTYYGGDTTDMFTSMCIDRNNDINLVGYTNSLTDIASMGAWYNSAKGDAESIYVKFDTSGKRLWSTFYGGERTDMFISIAANSLGNIYIAGQTNSTQYIATAGSHQVSLGDSTLNPYLGYYLCDAFLVKVNPDSVLYLDTPVAIKPLCTYSSTIQLHYTLTKSFNANNTITAQLSDKSGSFNNPVVIGIKQATASGIIDCKIPGNIPQGKGYRIRLVASSPYYVSNDNGNDIEIIQGVEPFKIVSGSPLCSGVAMRLSASGNHTGMSHVWTGVLGFYNTDEHPVINDVQTSHSGIYTLLIKNGDCFGTDTTDVIVNHAPDKPILKANSPIIAGDILMLEVLNPYPGASYLWKGPSGFSSDLSTEIINNVRHSNAGIYTFTTSINDCSAVDSINVIVSGHDIDEEYVELYPSPNNGTFTLLGKTKTEQTIFFDIINSVGQNIARYYVNTRSLIFNAYVTMPDVASGAYYVKLRLDGKDIAIPFVVDK